MIKLSIVTINLNNASYLEQTILSVLDQKKEGIEYGIIDGGSSDQSLEIIKKYQNQIDFYVSEKDGGISHAFNKAILRAKGQWIGLLNSSDWYEKTALDQVIQKIEQNPQVGVIHGSIIVWSSNKKICSNSPPQKKMVLKAEQEIDLLKKEMVLNHAACFVKKQVYLDYGMFKESYRYAMDYELMLRFYCRSVDFLAIDNILSNIYLGGLSDQHWFLSQWESYLAKRENGIKFSAAILSFLFYTSKTFCRKLLEFLGLHSLVYCYRKTQKRKY